LLPHQIEFCLHFYHRKLTLYSILQHSKPFTILQDEYESDCERQENSDEDILRGDQVLHQEAFDLEADDGEEQDESSSITVDQVQKLHNNFGNSQGVLC
jgi:hypothetical protein